MLGLVPLLLLLGLYVAVAAILWHWGAEMLRTLRSIDGHLKKIAERDSGKE